MKVIVVDDEKAALLIVKKMLIKIPDIEVTGSFQSAEEAYDFICKNRTDMAFVDIRMPNESGLEFARRVTAQIGNVAITFLTAYKEYALEAFDVQAFDYIVKPVSQIRLEESVERVKKRFLYLQHLTNVLPQYKLWVHCLGCVEVRNDRDEAVQFTSSKSVEVFAYLVLKRGREVSKWSIIEDVFPLMPLRNAEIYLNTTIYKLRKALAAYNMKSIIVSSNESYRIDVKDIYVDFIDFEKQLASISKESVLEIEELLRIKKLYSGELFGEKYYSWALAEKERLSETYCCISKKLVEALISNNRLVEALIIGKELININELDEEINCLLMKIYAGKRDRLSLEKQFVRYHNLLKEELGVGPEDAVQQLYDALIKKHREN